MLSLVLVTLAVGCALGAQPGVWTNDTCQNPESYVLLGEDAPPGQFPYMLSLNFAENKGHACGASVLTKNWALTAAHCCSTGHEMYLYSGSHSLSQGGTEHRIDYVQVHENYQPKDYWKNDICVMRVKDPFVLGKNVQKVTLPPQGYSVNDGDRLTITGWGYTKPDDDVVPDKLQMGKNFVALSFQKCLTKTGHFHSSYLCAVGGKTGQGVCHGDSGSPLVKNGIQVGIASWAFKPCGCGKPDFYARVPAFIDWIKFKLGKDAAELQFKK